MVNSTRDGKQGFVPIVLTIESKEELNFLDGLFNGGQGSKKKDCAHYDESIDEQFWEEISKWT